MANATVRNVHIDQPLSNFSVGYHPFGMVAEQIVPVVRVKNESDKYYIWDRASAFRTHQADGNFSLRADKAESKEIDFSFSTSNYVAEEYALHILVSDRERDNADSVLRLRESKVRRLKDLLLLEQELRVATLLTTSGNWDAGNTGTPAVKWDAASAVVIEKNIDVAKEAVRRAIGVYPNTIVIPAPVAQVMKRDASIRDLIKYTQNSLLVNGDLPPTLFNMKVVIAGSTYTTTTEGSATTTYSDVWSDNVVLLNTTTEDIDAPTPCKIFRSRDWEVYTWREDKRRSDAIETSVVQDEVMTSNVAGYLLTDVLT